MILTKTTHIGTFVPTCIQRIKIHSNSLYQEVMLVRLHTIVFFSDNIKITKHFSLRNWKKREIIST
jgi:hypothetical protein